MFVLNQTATDIAVSGGNNEFFTSDNHKIMSGKNKHIRPYKRGK